MSEMNEQFEEDFDGDGDDSSDVGTPDAGSTVDAGTPVDAAALEHRLLAHLQNPNYRPVKPRVIAKKLGLSEVETRELRRLVKKLVRRGQIVYGANHLIGPA